MVQVLCDGARCERAAQVSMDNGFLGERESGDRVSPVLVIRERRHKMTWAILVPRKGTEFPWIAKRAAKFINQLGTTELHSDATMSRRLKRWRERLHKLVKKDIVLAGGVCGILDEQV